MADVARMDLQKRTNPFSSFVTALNGKYHRTALLIFMAIVLAHWVEHIVQAYQVYVLGIDRPHAGGALGMIWPWLVSSETLHYGYAVVMLIGLFLLRPGFTGTSLTWWTVALVIQFWHHIEHLLLFIQALFHTNFFGKAVPTSIVQLFFPRMELHLFYNGIVFIPMVIAVFYHMYPSKKDAEAANCTCARRTMEYTGV